MAATLARAFHAYGLERRQSFAMPRFNARHIETGGQVIIHKCAVKQLPILVIHETLVKRISDPLGYAAMDLSIQD